MPRSRLSRILSRGAEAKLTLVSAPAGFGKTTLLGAWLAQADAGGRCAWLSLGRRTPARGFWTYVVTALHGAAPGVGAGVLPLLQSAPLSIENLLTTVLNEFGRPAARPRSGAGRLPPHRRPGRSQAGLAFLLEHLPPQVTGDRQPRGSRAAAGPPPCAWRLVEMRAADLRFTARRS